MEGRPVALRQPSSSKRSFESQEACSLPTPPAVLTSRASRVHVFKTPPLERKKPKQRPVGGDTDLTPCLRLLVRRDTPLDGLEMTNNGKRMERKRGMAFTDGTQHRAWDHSGE